MKHVQGSCKTEDFVVGDELVDKEGKPIPAVVLLNKGYAFTSHGVDNPEYVWVKKLRLDEDGYDELWLSRDELASIHGLV